ncbi:MAG: nitronate monooxygenase [Pseudonocardia sp.]|nr:nitronate monooxygenase [Pseudonocardia sp.]
MSSFAGNRVVRDTGATYPILNAPIGYFARAELAGAVSAAGGAGLMETSSAPLADVSAEFDAIRERTDAPVGIQLFLRVLLGQDRLDEVLDWALDGRTSFVVSCVGKPALVAERIKDSGATYYHQVGGVDEALRAVDAGVDGLIVEGAESGGLRGPRALHLFSLLQQVRARVDVPIIAAGGIADGFGMAGAFALGAEGVMMGTRFISAAESPVHQNWKDAIADCAETLSIETGSKGVRMRVVRNDFSDAVARGEVDPNGSPYAGPFRELFENGRLDKAMAGCGESATLIDGVKPVAEIIDETVEVFWSEMGRLAGLLRVQV